MTKAATSDAGFRVYPGYLDRSVQTGLVEAVRAGIAEAPLFTPVMPGSGAPLSVRMTNFGPLGWIAAKSGYRYDRLHPETGRPWPAMPQAFLDLWFALTDYPAPPEACLVNYYGPSARLGLHVDADEDTKDAPVVSVSLGDRARFRLGGPARKDPTRSILLSSGDVVVLGGPARRFHHGVNRIYPGTSTLLPEAWRPGRINLTLRRVTRPSASPC